MHETTVTTTARPPRTGEAGGLISALLADQSDLSAVERFARFHDDADAPRHDRFYRSPLPAEAPGPGQQYAFEVDLDRCSGCKACVAACHALNGLDDDEAWRDVGLIVGRRGGLPVLQHVTSSCHHCLDPACLAACPVDAYEKDPVTGIVRHLDDQCFGCQYCTLACPYDAPKYHAGKGIVRKCDMCSDRLAAGEAPACVQACPYEAIRIRVVDLDEVIERAAAGTFLPEAPDPGFTLPTTFYLSKHAPGDEVLPADGHRDIPEHAHASLVVMLVLTQASVGTFVFDFILRASGLAGGVATRLLLAIGLGLGHLGLIASLFHLGRPQFAYRALIGLRHSWLSREVAAFGAFATLATAHAALNFASSGGWGERPALFLSAIATAAGLAAVACSGMVYHATRRPFWHLRPTLARFAGTAMLLGALVLLVAASWGEARGIGLGAALAAMAVAAIKLRGESDLLSHADDVAPTPAARSARLLRGPLAGAWRLRRALGVTGGILLPALWMGLGRPMVPATGAAAATLALTVAAAGELAERVLFFAAVVRPKMPGGVS
jgi:Fe-S-cluster-containing dehydrogenase component/DMSO reductase anchor subunit